MSIGFKIEVFQFCKDCQNETNDMLIYKGAVGTWELEQGGMDVLRYTLLEGIHNMLNSCDKQFTESGKCPRCNGRLVLVK